MKECVTLLTTDYARFKDPHESCNLVITQLNAQNRGAP